MGRHSKIAFDSTVGERMVRVTGRLNGERIRSVSLRWKLGVSVILFDFLVLLGLGILGSGAESDIYHRETELRTKSLMQVFAIPIAIALANRDHLQLDNYMAQFSSDSGALQLEELAVLDPQGVVVAHTRPQEYGKTYQDEFSRKAMASGRPLTTRVTIGRNSFLEVSVPVVSGLRWGTLRARASLAHVDAAVNRSRLRLIAEGLAVTVVAGIIAFLVLSLLVVRPILRIQEMASRFGAGELAARVKLDQKDEMGELAAQLNSMAQQIEDYTGSLEKLVTERTSELQLANQQLETLARTDPLTGLANRRHFMEQLEFEVRRGARTKYQFALIMIDVDHFKNYNDAHGHPAGDEVLCRLAALMRLNLRSTDLIARYGGEEFVILLYDTGVAEGLAISKKLQQAVASQPLPHDETQPGGKVTISLGVAFFPQDAADAKTLINLADQALYRSKARGRNTLTAWSELA